MKSKSNVNVYLVLTQGESVLLSLRENTGYQDGKWALVSGHQETGEAATQALVREAQEEIGISIEPSDLEVVHVMHRKTDRENVDIFMHCAVWKGEIQNKEPHKCGGLEFFNFNALPKNILDYNQDALHALRNKQFYSEQGW